MKIDYLLIILIFLVKCGGEPEKKSPEEKNIPEDTSLVKTDTVSEIDSSLYSTVNITYPKKASFGEKVKVFEDAYAHQYERIESESKHILERFGNAGGKTLILKSKIPYKNDKSFDVYPEIQFRFFSYTDSSQRANAMSNWLACFGNDCITLIEGEKLNRVDASSGMYIINEKEIITFDYNCEPSSQDIKQMIKNIETGFANAKSTIIYVDCRKRLNWKIPVD